MIRGGFPTLLLALVLAGCGGSGSDGSTTDRDGSTFPSPGTDLARAKAAAERYVDDNDCALESDRYAAEGYQSAKEGHEACRASTDPGLQAGEYTVKAGSVTGDTARVVLALNGGGLRTYDLVRGGPSGWLIDGLTERLRGVVGDTFTFRDSYEQNGNPVNVDLRVTVVSVKDNVAAPEFSPAGRGQRWVRARVRIRSRGKESFSQSTDDFKLVDATGQRYTAVGSAFQPTLGNGGVDLSQGDTVLGYLGFKVPSKARIRTIRLDPTFSSGSPPEWRIK